LRDENGVRFLSAIIRESFLAAFGVHVHGKTRGEQRPRRIRLDGTKP
jgi:hypothetical protein